MFASRAGVAGPACAAAWGGQRAVDVGREVKGRPEGLVTCCSSGSPLWLLLAGPPVMHLARLFHCALDWPTRPSTLGAPLCLYFSGATLSS